MMRRSSSSPIRRLYKLYKNWNFWTDDAEEVQAILKRFQQVVVIHGHTHQLLTNRIGNIHFHGMLSTAWPWPYAPEGMPELTIQMSRPDPFDPNDGCGDGEVRVHAGWSGRQGLRLWNRNPITVSRAYTASWGKQAFPRSPTGLPIEHAKEPNHEQYLIRCPVGGAVVGGAPVCC